MTGQQTPQRVLDVPLDPGDAATEGETVRGYLKRVGRLSGDNSTWKWPLYVALAEAGLLPGVAVDPADADGDVLGNFPEAAQAQADGLIAAAAKALEASSVTGDTSPDVPASLPVTALRLYLRATGWAEGPQGSYGSVFERDGFKISVPHEDDDPDATRMSLHRLASAEGRAPEATRAAIAAHRAAPLVMPADEFAAVKAVAEACGPQVARGAGVDAAVPDDSDRRPLGVHGHAQERTGPSSPDDREPYGRIVRETWIACVLDYFEDPKNSWVASYDETDDFQRELDMRIGSAVAARAVADAGGEAATARTDRDRMRMERGAMASYLPAIRDALSAAVADARYDAQAKPFRAALEALGDGKTQDRSDEKERL